MTASNFQNKSLLLLLLFSIFFSIVLFSCNAVTAQELSVNDGKEQPILYYFWGHCPICSKPEDHVGLFEDYPVEVAIYEVFHDDTGREQYDHFRDALGIETFGFPTVVYGDRYWLGFSETVQEEIIAAIEASLEMREAESDRSIVRLPLLGEIDLKAAPILLTTVLVAFLDGFNPCSLFVLTFLLAIIIHSASRKKIFLIGFTFLLVTSAVYGLFILGVVNIMIFATRLFWIRNIIAALVIVVGLFGIKDFLVVQQGPTFSIPEQQKSKFYRQVRKIFYTDSTLPMIGATAVMALGIALVELPCSAGFPFIWSTIIAGMDISANYFIVLFTIYILIYLIDEIVIFTIAVVKMRSAKLTEEQGRTLKLIAGALMLVLGLILLFRPDYMENLTGLIISFGAAFALTIIIYQFKKHLSRTGGR
jgi:cytochrome c biogenesis protein CcdA